MAKRPVKQPEIDPDDLPAAELPNAIDDEARPGESMDEYMDRLDEDESHWTGKQGGRGAKKHDANESRRRDKVSEFFDPNMGSD